MTNLTLGIRREDKNRWERRVPLVPADLKALEEGGLRFLVQPSPIRVFTDEEYRAAGIEVDESLAAAELIFAVKEIPTDLLRPGKVYVYFAHVIKGQPHNMPMLARLMELGCSLVDYETIADERGRRLIFFGLHAGYAGMIEGLWCLDRRLRSRGRPSPFEGVRHAYEYDDLEQARSELEPIAARLHQGGSAAGPLIVGIAGYGNVARGCREVLGWLDAVEVGVDQLADLASGRTPPPAPLLEVVFKEEHMVEPLADPETGVVPAFELQDYYDNPERYRGCFERYLPHLDMLVNAAYWDERYPRLVTRRWARESQAGDREPRLQVIADISCDIEGGVELTLESTQPDAPCFTYDARTDTVETGYAGAGPVIMAVDNLPCELPRESSEYFSRVLRDMVPALAAADWRAGFDKLELPAHLERAVIVHRGELTPAYRHLKDHLETTT